MRMLAITLVAAGSLAVMALGGGAIAADRTPRARHSVEDSTTMPGAAPAATRLWYGGTLAPIQVQAAAPAKRTAAPKPACPPRN